MGIRVSVAAVLLAVSLLPIASAAQEAPPPIKRHGEPGLLPEPRVMTIGLDFVGRYLRDDGREGPDEASEGLYPVLKGGVPGAGWLSIGSGYRRRVFGDLAVIDGSAAVSWRGYKTAQVTFEFVDLAPRLVVGSQALWQDLTQLQYFGAGGNSLLSNQSDYRLKTREVVGYAKYRPTRWLSVVGRMGRLGRPTLSSSAGTFDRNFPDAIAMFPHEPGFGLPRQPGFLHGQMSITADTRDYPGHPTSGGLYRAASSHYSDRDLSAFSFRRSEFEAMQFVPLSPDRWTLALHGWTVISHTSDDQQMPVYLLPSLGGSTTLRSYADYRFHDRNLLLVSAESRWALFRHVDLAMFVDAGGVAARAVELDPANVSYGIGLRAHTHSATTARFDMAYGGEGWRFIFRLHEPFRLSRLWRRTAAIPFVP
jgi:hypothetical protein